MPSKPIITFDVWGTLIRSNPDFNKERIEYIFNCQQCLNLFPSSIDDIKYRIERSKIVINKRIEENNEYTFSPRQVYYQIAPAIDRVDLYDADREFCIDEVIDEIFIRKQPQLISKNTHKILEELNNRYVLGICSNTLLTKGKTILRAFENMGISKYFNYRYVKFSDEERCHKPNERMFVKDAVAHIGDNPLADGACEKHFTGMKYIQINTNNTRLEDLPQLFHDLSI